MSENTFEKTNLGWQLSQLFQRINEWWELQLSRLQPNLPKIPNVSTPDWLNEITWLLVRVAFWALLGWVTIRLVLWLIKQVQPYWNSPDLRTKKPTNLPVRELTTAAWLSRSRALYSQGNYREAARALYMAMLQQLNDSGIAPHQLSRTDGEYLQITQDLPQNQAYQTLLKIHERLCFGDGEISRTAFERCQQAYQELQRLSSMSNPQKR